MKNIKRNLCLLIVFSLILTLLTACGSKPTSQGTDTTSGGDQTANNASSDDVRIFKFAFSQPATSANGKGYEYFAQQVEKESGGSIKIELYPSGTLVPEPELPEALMNGTADIAHLAVTYLSPTIKELTPLEVPGVYRGDRFMDYAYGIKDVVDSIYQKYGLKHLLAIPGGSINIASTSKQVKSPADLKGMNVRASGKWVGEAMEKWGGNPVTIPIGEISTALDRNTVNAVYAGDITVIGPFKLYEMAKYITKTSLNEIYAAITMNLDAWNSLSADQQAAINRAVDSWAIYTEKVMADERFAYDAALKENENIVYTLTDTENNAFVEQAAAIMPEIEAFCGEDGNKLIKALEDVRAGYSKPYQPGIIPGKTK